MKSPLVAAAGVAAALLVASGIHCDGSTGDHRVRFGAQVRGAGAAGVTERGWALQFERFVVAFGPVRMYSDDAFVDPAAPACARRRPGLLERLSLGVALAQHCHGCPRAPVAEFGFERGGAVDRAVDLLAPAPVDLGPGNARSGLYRSVSFTFRAGGMFGDAGASPDVGVLAGHSMVVRGTATRGAEVVRFAGAIDLQTQNETSPNPTDARPYTTYGVMFDRPDGVAIDATREATDHAAIRVDLARMFDQADFAQLAPAATPDGERAITPDDQAYRAWRLGVENPLTYRVSWVGAGGCGEPR